MNVRDTTARYWEELVTNTGSTANFGMQPTKNAVPSPSTNVIMDLTTAVSSFLIYSAIIYYIRFPKLMNPISVESEKKETRFQPNSFVHIQI